MSHYRTVKLAFKQFSEVELLNNKGWALQPTIGNNSINLGTGKAPRIDLALKVRSVDVISPMNCLTSLKSQKSLAELWRLAFNATFNRQCLWGCKIPARKNLIS